MKPWRELLHILPVAASITALLICSTGLSATTERLQPCELGSRHEEAPKELDQFSFLVGNFDIKARRLQDDGEWTSGYQAAYWEGRWILGGFAIADYWYGTPPTGRGDSPGRGVNIRMYNQAQKQWANMWQHSSSPAVLALTSEVRADGLMHMWPDSQDSPTRRRMTFHIESPDHWYRIQERSSDGGKTWAKFGRLDAHQAPCPWVGPPENGS